jgi:hypothetical protein
MGSLLATVLFVVPLITWLSGIILLTDSQSKLARPHRAPRVNFPLSQKSYSPANRLVPRFPSSRAAVDEVSR